MDATDRFLKKVKKKPDGCWEWTGGSTFLLEGRTTARPLRSAMTLWGVGTGYPVRCHRWRACVNPAHLSSTTERPLLRGYDHPRCLLNRQLAERIRQRANELVKPGNSAAYYGRLYGVSREAIRLIRDYKTNGGIFVDQDAVVEIRMNCRSGYYSRIKRLSSEFGLSAGVIWKAILGTYNENQSNTTRIDDSDFPNVEVG